MQCFLFPKQNVTPKIITPPHGYYMQQMIYASIPVITNYNQACNQAGGVKSRKYPTQPEDEGIL